MDKLYYCIDCKRISPESGECSYCKSVNIKELVKNAPVNVIGSKTKGRVLKIKDGMVQVLVKDEGNNSSIKEYEASKIRKIL